MSPIVIQTDFTARVSGGGGFRWTKTKDKRPSDRCCQPREEIGVR